MEGGEGEKPGVGVEMKLIWLRFPCQRGEMIFCHFPRTIPNCQSRSRAEAERTTSEKASSFDPVNLKHPVRLCESC